ncbi:hypothetical protein A9Q84_14875 [Halobacteriovorax marinus]|uniref:Peptidase S1 domain-containing protein n=1 Tax=Halobacteriovorax marinus TaxID=97084 RepID=A0A1Y5F549_9BACT|nr:hypothetical protein A9Q84_14875 [Halobacteriovorax marinus]
MRKTILALSTLAVLASCGKNYNEGSDLHSGSILNGVTAREMQFSNVVGLKSVSGSMMRMCSSTLISPYILLTAAHCAKSAGEAVFKNNIDDTDLNIKIEKTIVHGDYKEGNTKDDIALLILSKRAPVALDKILPLITKKEIAANDIGKGDTVTIVGYGRDENGNSGIKKYRDVKIVKNFFCSDYSLKKVFNLERGAYYGDSGGAAFIKIGNKVRQIGVAASILEERTVLFVEGVCARSFYVNVTRHSDWILKHSGYYKGVDHAKLSANIIEKYNLARELNRSVVRNRVNLSSSLYGNIEISIHNYQTYNARKIPEFARVEMCNDSKCKTLETKSLSVLNYILQKRYEINQTITIPVSEVLERMDKYPTIKLSFHGERRSFFSSRPLLATLNFPADLSQNFTARDLEDHRSIERFTVLDEKDYKSEIIFKVNQ